MPDNTDLGALDVLPAPPSTPGALRRFVSRAEIIAAIRQDHLGEGASLAEVARSLDVPRRRVYAEWRLIVDKARAAGLLTTEERETLRAFVLGSYEEIAEAAMQRIDEHAAYGAVAINALDKLWQAAGLDEDPKDDDAQAGGTIRDRLRRLMEAGRKLSPLLTGKHTGKPHLSSLDPSDMAKAKAEVDEWEPEPIDVDAY